MTAYSGELDAERLMQLSDEVSRIAGTLAELTMGMSAPPAERKTPHAEEMTEVSPESVKWLIKARRQRRRYIAYDLFADPAWDILLDLFHAEITHRRVHVSSLCIASGVPATTGLRWVKNMVDEGVLVRKPDQHDGRRAFVELAPEVSQALRRYFIDVVQTQDKVA